MHGSESPRLGTLRVPLLLSLGGFPNVTLRASCFVALAHWFARAFANFNVLARSCGQPAEGRNPNPVTQRSNCRIIECLVSLAFAPAAFSEHGRQRRRREPGQREWAGLSACERAICLTRRTARTSRRRAGMTILSRRIPRISMPSIPNSVPDGRRPGSRAASPCRMLIQQQGMPPSVGSQSILIHAIIVSPRRSFRWAGGRRAVAGLDL